MADVKVQGDQLIDDLVATTSTGAGNIIIEGNTISSTDGPVLLTPNEAGAISNIDANLTNALFKLNVSNGVETLDQQQLGRNAAIADENAWQSFTPSVSGYLSKTTMEQFSGSAATGKTLTIRFGEGAAGTVLSTVSGLTLSVGFNDIVQTDPPFLNAGQLYTMKFSGGSGLAWGINLSGGYAGGRSSNDPNRDFYFKTFMEGEYNFVFTKDTQSIGLGIDVPTEKLDILGSAKVSEDVIVRGLRQITINENLADDAFIDLTNSAVGYGFVMAGDNEEYVHFSFSSAGVVILHYNSTNVVNTDTDTNLCIFDNGTNVRIRNRLGAAKDIKATIYLG